MSGLYVLAAWFPLGLIGAMIGRHRWRKLFGSYEGCETSAAATILAGPLGLGGVILWSAMLSTSPDYKGDERGK